MRRHQTDNRRPLRYNNLTSGPCFSSVHTSAMICNVFLRKDMKRGKSSATKQTELEVTNLREVSKVELRCIREARHQLARCITCCPIPLSRGCHMFENEGYHAQRCPTDLLFNRTVKVKEAIKFFSMWTLHQALRKSMSTTYRETWLQERWASLGVHCVPHACLWHNSGNSFCDMV